MGIFNKIKNVLFEEEEIEIPVFTKEKTEEAPKNIVKRTYEVANEPKIETKKESTPVKVKQTVEQSTERETFKIEPTFQFPVFDEKEFDKPQKSRSNKNVVPKKTIKIDFGRFEDTKKEKEQPKQFVPSPVISPVYGVLDKNYTKSNVTNSNPKKERVIDVDSIRNKAYGTLEDDIENTFTTSTNEFYEPTKTIDELLIDSVNEEIELNDVSLEDIEEKDDSLDVLDEIEKEINQTKTENLEDTLENDLFNLIDSMYTNKEEDK